MRQLTWQFSRFQWVVLWSDLHSPLVSLTDAAMRINLINESLFNIVIPWGIFSHCVFLLCKHHRIAYAWREIFIRGSLGQNVSLHEKGWKPLPYPKDHVDLLKWCHQPFEGRFEKNQWHFLLLTWISKFDAIFSHFPSWLQLYRHAAAV